MHPPDSAFSLSSTGKADISATVDQAKTEFTYADGVRIGESVVATGTVTASGMTAGEWHGQYQFNVSLDAEEAEPETIGFFFGQTADGVEHEIASVLVDGEQLNKTTFEDLFASPETDAWFDDAGFGLGLNNRPANTEVTIVYSDDSTVRFTLGDAPEEIRGDQFGSVAMDSLADFLEMMGG